MIVLNWQISTKLEDGSEVGYMPSLAELALLKLNSKVAFAVTKNLKKFSASVELKLKTREAILIAWSAKDADDKPLIIDTVYQFPDDEAKTQCIKEMTDLEQLDSGVDIHQINEADLESVDGLSVNLIFRLGDLIKAA